jgi:hypothetical protein
VELWCSISGAAGGESAEWAARPAWILALGTNSDRIAPWIGLAASAISAG